MRCLFERVIGRVEIYLWSRHSYIRIEHWNIRLSFGIKVDSRNIIKASYSLLYSCKQNLPNGLFVFKLYLSLCRMNIYVYILSRHIEVEEVWHLLSLWYQSIESSDNSLMKIRMFHITIVDKEILMRCFLTCRLWFTNKAMDMTKARINIYRQKILIETLTKNLHNTLTIATSTKTKQLCPVTM